MATARVTDTQVVRPRLRRQGRPSQHRAAPPEQAAAIAQRAGVRYLLFTHVIPPLPLEALEGPFLGKSRQIFHGPIQVGHDGDFLTLPAGTTEIRRSNRLKTFL